MLTLNYVKDTFEDAIDTGSVRSLTNRKLSPRPSSGATDGVPETPESPPQKEKVNGDAAEGKENGTESDNGTVTQQTPTSKRNSNVSLDNVDLSDGVVEQPKGL